jgi:hypothetical protein
MSRYVSAKAPAACLNMAPCPELVHAHITAPHYAFDRFFYCFLIGRMIGTDRFGGNGREGRYFDAAMSFGFFTWSHDLLFFNLAICVGIILATATHIFTLGGCEFFYVGRRYLVVVFFSLDGATAKVEISMQPIYRIIICNFWMPQIAFSLQ